MTTLSGWIAVLSPDGQSVESFKNLGPTPVAVKAGRVLPAEIIDPAFDPASQVREGPTVTILADKVRREWTVRAKTAAELDADKGAVVDAIDMLAFKVLFNHENRIRALEGKAAITAAQFRTALKALL